MFTRLKQYLADKKILILGFGREGKSTYYFLREFLPGESIAIADINENNLPSPEAAVGVKFYCGPNYLESIFKYDVIVKSPGISLKDVNIENLPGKISSQTDLFLRFCRNKIIGVTGTKGKSTTASLIFSILKSHFNDVQLVGNIGIPPFEKWANFTQKTIVVCEFSSYQLEFIERSPHIAVLLNLFPEHLDHHGELENYWEAKLNICKYQNEKDFFIYHADDPVIVGRLKKVNPAARLFSFSLSQTVKNGCFLSGKDIFFGSEDGKEKVYDIEDRRYLQGAHNLKNIMAAIAVGKILDVPNEVIKSDIHHFHSLPHRLEYVGEKWQIHFYNDSISTIPEATIAAVETLKEVDTLILGGFNRGISYRKLCQYLLNSKIRNLILLPPTGEIIWREMQSLGKGQIENKKAFFTNDFAEVVKIARAQTAPGKICLLSPAAPSYGMFRNFEERGDLFKKLILENRGAAVISNFHNLF